MRLPQLLDCIPLLLAALGSIPAVAASDAASQPADVIVTNARIYTLNPNQKWAEAIAVRGDKIVAVGRRKEKDIEALRGPSTRVIDAGQRLLLPGFTDCHIHFMDGSLGLTRVDLK
jgi:predicted amidohydrolase YtcJ